MKTGKEYENRFNLARRGYDRSEVDAFVSETENEIAGLRDRIAEKDFKLETSLENENELRAKVARLEAATSQKHLMPKRMTPERRREWIRLGIAVLSMLGTLCARKKEEK